MLAEVSCDEGTEQMKLNARINSSHSSYLPPSLSLSFFPSCMLPLSFFTPRKSIQF